MLNKKLTKIVQEEAARPKFTVKEAIQRWEATGRIAIHHPRKGTISLDGGRAMGEDAAVRRIQECLDRLAV